MLSSAGRALRRHGVLRPASQHFAEVSPLGMLEMQRRGAALQAQGGRSRLVILGTGWASFRVLMHIDSKQFDVAVVSPRNHLLFTPMLPSSAVGTVNQRSICQPVRPLVAKKKARYYESQATKIDKANKKVHCLTPMGHEYSIPFDMLVVGVGFQPNDFGIPGVKEHALFMKETEDARIFKDHILSKLEEASYMHALDSDMNLSEAEMEKIREILTFIIIGGGPTGVELAGELTDFLQAEGVAQYGYLKKWVTVHMFTYDLLNTFDTDLQEYALTHLRKKQGVQIHLGAFVQSVEKDVVHVKTSTGDIHSIKYGTLAWCAGVKPHPFIRDYDFQMNDRGTQILTDKQLRVKGEQAIFAIGDCAAVEDYWLPQTAQVAKQQGIYLSRTLNNGEAVKGIAKPFVFKSLGMMAYLGGYNALLAKLPGLSNLSISGFLAFLGWRSVYWTLQLSLRNRFMLATDWLRTLLFGRDLTRFGPKSRPS
mmetsp:Transcript_9671/g.21578  ORF Transcript_9671/g.21578 Transcript_9671/m.21578 type:complete len:480 (-) Transcript_9671:79-1518(-)